MAARRRIADPHHHIWDLEAVYYPWLVEKPPSDFMATNPQLARNYLVPDYLADGRDFDLARSVHVEALSDPANPVAETRWVQQQADDPANEGFPHGIVAFADLMADDFAEVVAAHMRYPNLRGIRQVLSWETEPDMRDRIWRENFERLGQLGLIFDLQIEPSQMEDAVRLARDFPEVRISLNHTGLPDTTNDGGDEVWRQGIRELAQCDNVAVKISGPGIMDPNWTTASIRPFVLETIERFGVARCMFASDFPVDRLWRSFTDLWTAYVEITRDFSEQERSQLFHDNAVSIYHL